ncbi:hypothetical protein [Halostagnicola kamekurae]|uniref:C2H2-type domain-containing protein n=1 Tax=Halostagnicola kamekurae TaxID=619731 RepID=A0A1I6RGW4_9EURY|nr:hypothetical protein [Halostagnicola kamekurae]SFS63708.1 hypothetical protein SAMN04488556_1772 [Halostagnicola kamekurae]
MSQSECSVCGEELASPLAGPAHARKHKNRFEKLVGRRPDDYSEVQALFNEGGVPEDVDLETGSWMTLEQFVDGRAQLSPFEGLALVAIVSAALLFSLLLAKGVVFA